MKKQYMKPQVEVVTLEIHHMLAASPPSWGGELDAPPALFEGEEWDALLEE